jgi:hypothetical protein
MTTIDAPRAQQILAEGILSRAFHVLNLMIAALRATCTGISNELAHHQKPGTF